MMDILRRVILALAISVQSRLVQGQCPSPMEITALGDWNTISTPNYDSGGLANNMDCTWIIRNTGGKVGFYVYDVDLQNEVMINTAFYRGDVVYPTTQIFLNLNSLTGPSPVISSDDAILIKLQTGTLTTAPVGFRMYYTIIPTDVPGCSLDTDPDLTASSTEKYISSPNYPSPYSRNIDCTWNIISETGDPILFQITFFDLDMDSGTSQCNDILSLYDEPYSAFGEALAHPCMGLTIDDPTIYYTDSTSAAVRFVSDNNFIEGNGFLVKYWTQPQTTTPEPETTTTEPHTTTSEPDTTTTELDTTTTELHTTTSEPDTTTTKPDTTTTELHTTTSEPDTTTTKPDTTTTELHTTTSEPDTTTTEPDTTTTELDTTTSEPDTSTSEPDTTTPEPETTTPEQETTTPDPDNGQTTSTVEPTTPTLPSITTARGCYL